MTDWEEIVANSNPDALFIGEPDQRKELDKAIIGFVSPHGQPEVLVYSYSKLIEAFMRLFQDTEAPDVGDLWERACEWVDHNVACAYHGPNTPIIIHTAEEIP